MRLRRAAIALVVSLVASGCRTSSAIGPFPRSSVLLVTIDTLRTDHLRLYGYEAGSTPNLDALGRQGIVFEDVYSHCPLTLPAHASLFTGLLPPRHGVRDNVGFTLKEAHQTLAARFKAAGFRTGAAVSAFVLRRQTGIAQGFDFYDDAVETEGSVESMASAQRDGAVATEALARWVEEQGAAPFFAFLHLYEPHSPYAPPERHRHFPSPYDGEIAYADELVGRLLERLRVRGLEDRLIVIVTSDHGEGFKDHGEEEHGVLLYREAVHIPLILRLPDRARARTRVAGTVAQADIAPTLLELAGLPADGTDGMSLRNAIASGSAAAHPAYAETLYPRYHFGWSELYAVTEGRHRYIRAPRPELYDLGTDPRESRNLAAERASAAQGMERWLAGALGGAEVTAPEDVPAETREKLMALGYIGAGTVTVPKGDLPDPKDKIGAYEGLKRALTLRAAGEDAQAVAAFRGVLRDNPAMIDAWEMLGYTLIRMGRGREGIAAVEKVLQLDPLRVTAHLALAKVHALGGRADLAARHAEIASASNPGQGNEVLAQLMMDRGDLPAAAAYARRSVAADSDRIMSQFILGVAAQRAGRYEDALAHFSDAEQAKRRQRRVVVRNLHANMGDCLARLGREAEAEREFRAELEAIPHSEKARVGLAVLYRAQGRDAEARAALGGLITALPQPSADVYWRVVSTFSVLGDVAAAREWAARGRIRFPSDPRFR